VDQNKAKTARQGFGHAPGRIPGWTLVVELLGIANDLGGGEQTPAGV
jgi:hypothetical protein